MSRRAAGLSAAKVQKAGPGRYGDGNGLYLLVKPPGGARDGGRFWLFRYTMPGTKMREMGLGRAGSQPGSVTLAEARGRAADLYKQVRLGVDPLGEREAKAAAAKVRTTTFRDVAERYMDTHEAGLRNAKHRQQWRNTMATYAYPHMGEVAVGMVATAHVLAALQPIWTEKPETAARVRGRVEAVLDFARSLDLRNGENPARWKGHLSNALPSRAKVAPVEHHAALPWRDVAAFLTALRAQPGIAARALELAILTAARSGEVLNAKWPEFDLDAAVWTVPANRMKAGKEHRVPLSAPALAVLQSLLPMRDVDWTFPGQRRGRPLSNMAMEMVLRRMQRPDLTVHGFRSTFRDWAAECTTYQREVVEMALAHTVGNKVEAAYRRGDLFEKRRALMSDWATFCGSV